MPRIKERVGELGGGGCWYPQEYRLSVEKHVYQTYQICFQSKLEDFDEIIFRDLFLSIREVLCYKIRFVPPSDRVFVSTLVVLFILRNRFELILSICVFSFEWGIIV